MVKTLKVITAEICQRKGQRRDRRTAFWEAKVKNAVRKVEDSIEEKLNGCNVFNGYWANIHNNNILKV